MAALGIWRPEIGDISRVSQTFFTLSKSFRLFFFVSQDVVPREASAASFVQAADHSKPGPKSGLEGMSSECHDIMMSWFIIRFIIVYRPRKG